MLNAAPRTGSSWLSSSSLICFPLAASQTRAVWSAEAVTMRFCVRPPSTPRARAPQAAIAKRGSDLRVTRW